MGPALFALSTLAWQVGSTIPSRYTCTGADRSPALSWTAPPAGAASLAVVFDDPDAPGATWTHWIVWGLPAASGSIAEGVAPVAPGMVQGTNDFGKPGYGGPCPPPGHGLHRYFVRLYALDVAVDLPPAADRNALDAAMAGHVVAITEWMGKFGR